MLREPQIPRYYANRKILITGATGFMGKVLLWKLLQSCPEIGNIYVLIRPKKGTSGVYRREELFKSVIFDDLKKHNPSALDKTIFISGDVGEEGIGLSDSDRDTLINEVSIVFHGAAILKMNASLKTAINVNTQGTLRMLHLAEQMKQLEAFVYISTAYCCCENEQVEEKLYHAKHNPYNVIKLTTWMDPKILQIITPKMIEPLPNTYTYSKRLTESLLNDFQKKVPIIVARPTIVTPALKEPIPGWVDNMNGPVGFFIAGGTGLLRTMMINSATKSNIICVDVAVNGIIVLPWMNRKECLLKEISIYNVSQTECELKSWDEYTKYATVSAEKYPFEKKLWYMNPNSITTNVLKHKMKVIFCHWTPAYLIDFILKIIGQKPFMVRAHQKIQQGEDLLRFFTYREWSFASDKILQINQLMSEADRQIYPITMKEFTNLQKHFDEVTLVARHYLVKEDPSSLEFCRKRDKILYCLDKAVVLLRYALLIKLLFVLMNVIINRMEIYQNYIDEDYL